MDTGGSCGDKSGGEGKRKHKKTKRGKGKIKKELENFKIYYVNTRGVRSKLDSIGRIAREVAPQVLCLTETMLGEGEKIEVEGYKIFYNNNKSGKGGIIIAVGERLGGVTIETEKTNDEFQTLWIKIDNTRNKINVGCVYAPQESRAKIGVFNRMYQGIASRIDKAKHDGERVVIAGDFNAKVGEKIKGNKKEISKSGKVLCNMILERDLALLNCHVGCEGRWTRILGKEKSVIDYMMLFQEDEGYVRSVFIDENKMITPRYREGKKTIYSDHCATVNETTKRRRNG